MGVDTSTFTDICRVCAVVGVTFRQIITLHNEACWKGNRAGNILNKIHHVTSVLIATPGWIRIALVQMA